MPTDSSTVDTPKRTRVKHGLFARLWAALFTSSRLGHERRIEALEDGLDDLRERFRRKENRENMRSAREVGSASRSLSQEAMAILAQAKPASDDPTDKSDLWSKLQ